MSMHRHCLPLCLLCLLCSSPSCAAGTAPPPLRRNVHAQLGDIRADSAADAPSNALLEARASGLSVTLERMLTPRAEDSTVDGPFTLSAQASSALTEIVSYVDDVTVGRAALAPDDARRLRIELASHELPFLSDGTRLRVGLTTQSDGAVYTLAVALDADGRLRDATLMRDDPALTRRFVRDLRASARAWYAHHGLLSPDARTLDEALTWADASLVSEIVDARDAPATHDLSRTRVLRHPDLVEPLGDAQWLGVYDRADGALLTMERLER